MIVYRFALLAASVFLHHKIRVYFYSEYVPTPLVVGFLIINNNNVMIIFLSIHVLIQPYAIIKHSCLAGIMITASHNPKQDNGYKAYWSNGAQVIIMF